MLYRRFPQQHLQDEEVRKLEHLDKRFGLDNKRIVFNTRTFVEEFLAHVIGSVIGPLSIPFVYMLSGWTGGVITAFIPGVIRHEGEKPYSNLLIFYFQIFVWAVQWLPIFVAGWLFLSGRIVTHRARSIYMAGTEGFNRIPSDLQVIRMRSVSALPTGSPGATPPPLNALTIP